MNPKEFRIGNLCQDQHGNLLQVSGLEDCVIFKVVDRSKYPLPDGWQAEPIPLTREWLERLGFIVPEFSTEWLSVPEIGEKYGNSGVRYNTETGRASYEQHYTRSEIKYVHQLQNLYFALTGEELQIKDV